MHRTLIHTASKGCRRRQCGTGITTVSTGTRTERDKAKARQTGYKAIKVRYIQMLGPNDHIHTYLIHLTLINSNACKRARTEAERHVHKEKIPANIYISLNLTFKDDIHIMHKTVPSRKL